MKGCGGRSTFRIQGCGWPVFSRGSALWGRGRAVIRTRFVGGLAFGGLRRSARADGVGTVNCHAFINSSLAPVILCRGRLCSVGEVLKGIWKSGFSTARWQAWILRWPAVCRQGPTGPISSLEPWKGWRLPDLHGCYECVF